MDEQQRISLILQNIALKIPQLFEAIKEGGMSSHFVLGTRQINGKQVQLIIRAEVVDKGGGGLDSAPAADGELAD